MKKLVFLFAVMAFFVSCEDIETNTPAFQANLNNEFYKSVQSRAEIKSDGTLVMEGLTDYEKLTIVLNGTEEGKYVLGNQSANRAYFENFEGSVYTTKPFGKGEVIIRNSGDNTLTGTFKFLAYRYGLDSLFVEKGHFYKVPIIAGSTGEEPEEAMHFFAKINEGNYIPTNITAVKSGATVVVTGATSNESISITFPSLAVPGIFEVGEQNVEITYTKEGQQHTILSGSIIITGHNQDAKAVSGNFSFETELPEALSITAGEFSVTY